MAPVAPAALPAMAKQSTPKTMSSRLMTMKFMQRGAAAAAATPEASPLATPKSEEGGSTSKRRKFSHAPSAANTPATPLYDQKAIQDALEEEEKKRLAAVERRAAELGDSHWVLPGAAAKPKLGARKPLNVVQVGFAQIDYSGTTTADSDSPFEESSAPAQTRFLRFNMKKAKVEKKVDEHGSDDSSDSDSDDNPDDDNSGAERKPTGSAGRGGQARGRRDALDNAAHKRARSSGASVSSKREEERKKAQQLAGKRRQKDIKLNQLSSISSAGSQAFQQRPASGMTCHGCGKVGHKAVECPSKRR